MKSREERVCPASSQEHADAVGIVEYLLNHNGAVEASQDEIAGKLGFFRDHGGGIFRIDSARFHRARNHIRDRVDAVGKPCCGFTVQYRGSRSESILALIDPSGDLGQHATAAIATVRGWVSRERQHHTENRRAIETFEQLGDHTLARGDRDGYRITQRAVIEIERDGTVSPETMAELEVWLASIS